LTEKTIWEGMEHNSQINPLPNRGSGREKAQRGKKEKTSKAKKMSRENGKKTDVSTEGRGEQKDKYKR